MSNPTDLEGSLPPVQKSLSTKEDTMLDSDSAFDGGKVGAETKVWQSKLQRVTLSCENLDVNLKKKEKGVTKSILKNVSAIFKPGTITALMGPSGAGKTTLLNVLSGKVQEMMTISAKSLKLNGEDLTPKDIRNVSSLVPQDDILIAVLSPREAITYGAKLALTGSEEEITAIVNKTLRLLSLEGCADTICGDADTKGISGGERKRTSIGLELITNPSLLFLDEPTSGLDSKVALDVVSALRNLAAEGKTIVCTIHQPSFECFSEFDRLLLLNKGQIAYQGRIDEVNNYFESVGYPCPAFKNPADHILNVVSDPDFKADFRNHHELYEEFLAYSKGIGQGGIEVDKNKRGDLFKIPLLIERTTIVTVKDAKGMRMRLIQCMVMGIVFGLSYLQLDDKQTSSFDRQSGIFMVTLFNMMMGLMGTIHAVPVEKAILKREYNNGVYTAFTWFFSRTIVAWSFNVMYALIYSALVYFMIGLEMTAANFFMFFAAQFLGVCLATSLGLFFGAVFPTVDQAMAIIPMIIMPLNLFSGLLISFDNIPVYFIWIYYISFAQYVFRICLINEFGDSTFDACTFDEAQNSGECPFGVCGGNLTDDPATFSANECPRDIVLSTSGFDDFSKSESFGILVAYMFAATVLSFIAIYKFLNGSIFGLPSFLKAASSDFKKKSGETTFDLEEKK